jgi:hypothetical protein
MQAEVWCQKIRYSSEDKDYVCIQVLSGGNLLNGLLFRIGAHAQEFDLSGNNTLHETLKKSKKCSSSEMLNVCLVMGSFAKKPNP